MGSAPIETRQKDGVVGTGQEAMRCNARMAVSRKESNGYIVERENAVQTRMTAPCTIPHVAVSTRVVCLVCWNLL